MVQYLWICGCVVSYLRPLLQRPCANRGAVFLYLFFFCRQALGQISEHLPLIFIQPRQNVDQTQLEGIVSLLHQLFHEEGNGFGPSQRREHFAGAVPQPFRTDVELHANGFEHVLCVQHHRSMYQVSSR